MDCLRDIVNKARKNPKVEALYRTVDAVSPISLSTRQDGFWSHTLIHGKSTIGVSPTQNPEESLYHELLHADLKNNGYNSLLIQAGVEERMGELMALLGPIDNELQHHRMFDRFVADGFASERFYCDADAKTFVDMREVLRGMPSDLPAAIMLLQFLGIIAPGGVMNDAERNELRALVRSKALPSTFEQLEHVEGIIKHWAANGEAGPELAVVAILKALGRYDRTWIGASPADFPNSGYFIGQPFSV